MRPKVSVLIPSFNDEMFIHQSIESVINQTFENWELIILDDCSTDATYEIALKYADESKIKVYRNSSNLGMLENWNKGINLCKSDYFVKLDADDYWHPEMLENATCILDEMPEVALVFTKYKEVDELNNAINNVSHLLPDFVKNKPFNCHELVKLGANKMLSHDILRQGLSVMRREVFDQVGKYRYLITKSTQASTDTEFYFRVGCHFKIFQLDEYLYYYRKHNNSISSVDTSNLLQPLKLYEVKTAILKYYRDNNIIANSFYNKEIKKVKFYYYSFLFSHNRKSGKYLLSLKYLLKNFIKRPIKTLAQNLHLGKLISIKV